MYVYLPASVFACRIAYLIAVSYVAFPLSTLLFSQKKRKKAFCVQPITPAFPASMIHDSLSPPPQMQGVGPTHETYVAALSPFEGGSVDVGEGIMGVERAFEAIAAVGPPPSTEVVQRKAAWHAHARMWQRAVDLFGVVVSCFILPRTVSQELCASTAQACVVGCVVLLFE